VLEDAVARWLWHEWAPKAATSSPPQDAIEAFLLRTCLQATEGSISDAARLLDMHPETFGSHLDKLGDPEISRTIRHHPLGPILERSVREDGVAELLDRTLRVVLTELLVYCRGNKSDMARHLDWGRQTLGRQLKRLEIVGRSKKPRATTPTAPPKRPHDQQ
jgi:DNA-binding NtrC family response regulator